MRFSTTLGEINTLLTQGSFIGEAKNCKMFNLADLLTGTDRC